MSDISPESNWPSDKHEGSVVAIVVCKLELLKIRNVSFHFRTKIFASGKSCRAALKKLAFISRNTEIIISFRIQSILSSSEKDLSSS